MQFKLVPTLYAFIKKIKIKKKQLKNIVSVSFDKFFADLFFF